MPIEIISALIGAVALILAEVVAYLLYKRHSKETFQSKNDVCNTESVSFLNPSFDFEIELEKVNSVMMYTVNSHELLTQLNLLFERNQQLKINDLIILVRKKTMKPPPICKFLIPISLCGRIGSKEKESNI